MIVVYSFGLYRKTQTSFFNQHTAYTITLPPLSFEISHNPAITIHTTPLSHTAAAFAAAVL